MGGSHHPSGKRTMFSTNEDRDGAKDTGAKGGNTQSPGNTLAWQAAPQDRTLGPRCSALTDTPAFLFLMSVVAPTSLPVFPPSTFLVSPSLLYLNDNDPWASTYCLELSFPGWTQPCQDHRKQTSHLQNRMLNFLLLPGRFFLCTFSHLNGADDASLGNTWEVEFQ